MICGSVINTGYLPYRGHDSVIYTGYLPYRGFDSVIKTNYLPYRGKCDFLNHHNNLSTVISMRQLVIVVL